MPSFGTSASAANNWIMLGASGSMLMGQFSSEISARCFGGNNGILGLLLARFLVSVLIKDLLQKLAVKLADIVLENLDMFKLISDSN